MACSMCDQLCSTFPRYAEQIGFEDLGRQLWRSPLLNRELSITRFHIFLIGILNVTITRTCERRLEKVFVHKMCKQDPIMDHKNFLSKRFIKVWTFEKNKQFICKAIFSLSKTILTSYYIYLCCFQTKVLRSLGNSA